jgi:hypothetical protein
MTTSLRCPHCNATGQTREDVLGKRVRYRHCHQLFVVPQPAEATAPPEGQETAGEAQSPVVAASPPPQSPDRTQFHFPFTTVPYPQWAVPLLGLLSQPRRRLLLLAPAVAVVVAVVFGVVYSRRADAWSGAAPRTASDIDTHLALYTQKDIPQLAANFGGVDEQLFVLFALEDMARKIPAATELPNMTVALYLNELASNLAQQRRAYDTLRRHLQDGENREFLDVFEEYAKVLDLMDQGSAELTKLLEIFQRGNRKINEAVGLRALASGIDYGSRSLAQGEDGETAFTRGISAWLDSVVQDQPAANDARKALWLQLTKTKNAFKKVFLYQINEATTAFFDKIRASKWGKDPDFAFKNVADLPTRNPFQVVVRAQAGLAGTQETATLIAQAKVCQQAARLVPPGPTYDLYRAQFLSAAGQLADKAAARDLGATGLPRKEEDAPVGGRLSEELWAEYVKAEPYDTAFTDDVVRAHFMSHAYAGHLEAAYDIIAARALERMPAMPKRRAFDAAARLHLSASAKPGFWYDCARVCSMTGHNRTAVACLKRAASLGFRDRAAAKFNPDFRQVRENQAAGDMFRQLFP